jgi:hypothetical protein
MSAFPFVLNEVDIIPFGDSSEVKENSEPSLAVDPLDPRQIIAGAFAYNFSSISDIQQPYFKSTDGGSTWNNYGTIPHTDKSLAWLQDGSAALTAALWPFTTPGGPGASVSTYSGSTFDSNFSAKSQFKNGSGELDQPWIRTGPSDHVYLSLNDTSRAGPGLGGTGDGKSASVLVSTDGGSNYSFVTIDKVGTTYQDGPSTRTAVNGDTVYALFVRWNSQLPDTPDGDKRYTSSLVIDRSDDGGADSFGAIGGGNGVQVAAFTDVYDNSTDTSLSMGANRDGSEIAIAVDPNNKNRVVVAYGDSDPHFNKRYQLNVVESTDGGVTWSSTPLFTTTSLVRSAEPGLAILANGTVGLLYNSYDPTTDTFTQHLLTTSDDFGNTNDLILGTEKNGIPTPEAPPYLGDFFDLTGIGNTFYGIFSASNADDGTNALLANTTFNRSFVGTPGTSSFQLTDASGNAVPFSIDPFFFAYSILNPASPPGVSANMVLREAGNGQYEIYNLGNNSILAAYWLGQVGTDWAFVTLGGFSGSDTSDMMLRNSTTGAFQVYDINNNNISSAAALGTVGLNWQVAGFGNFSSVGETDMILRDSASGGFQVYDIADNQIIASAFMGTVGLNWQVGGFGSFSSSASSGMILRDANTGGLQVYDISNNQFTNSAFMGAVGLDWRIEGFGDFSGRRGETDMLMRNVNTGGLLLYDIADNQITGANFLGPVGLDWQFAGVAPIQAPGASDLVLRNVSTGVFEVYNIANNQITGAAPLGQVGSDWQLGGFAPSFPTSSMGSSGDQPGSNAQLVQAMASFGGSNGAADSFNAVPLGADTSQQTLLTTPQHA